MPLASTWYRDDASGAVYQFLTVDIVLDHPAASTIVIGLGRGGTQSDEGIAVSFNVLPQVATRLCLPLARCDAEQLYLERSPGVLKTMIWGAGLALQDVGALHLGTKASLVPPTLHVSQVALHTEKPSSPALVHPLIDELGQCLNGQWETKTPDLDTLVQQLRREAPGPEIATAPALPSHRGFFGTRYHEGRWWLTDPAGEPFISVGFTGISPGESMRVEGMEHLAGALPSRFGEFAAAWSADGRSFNFGVANLIRAFGAGWWSQWQRITERRIRDWGITTIGCWSNAQFVHAAGVPYVLNLSAFPDTARHIFRDFPDVFSEEYERSAVVYAQQVVPLREDSKLIGYFLRNEPQWAFVPQVNLAAKMLASPEDFASKHALIQTLQAKYGFAIASLNAAWHADFTSYGDLLRGVDATQWSGPADGDLRTFTRRLITQYVTVPAHAVRAVDPHHLNLGMRYAWISSEDLWAGCETFDVFSLNMYQMYPAQAVLDRVHAATRLPILIGEFHHGSQDSGLPAASPQVATQADRGRAYRAYVEQGVAHPAVVGMHYFQWNDQPYLGRFDGENHQMGAVDVCQTAYTPFVAAMRETHRQLYHVASHHIPPYSDAVQAVSDG